MESLSLEMFKEILDVVFSLVDGVGLDNSEVFFSRIDSVI